MEVIHFTAGPDDQGRRLDKILKKILKNCSVPKIYKAVRKGLVKLNGKKSAPEQKIEENDDIEIAAFLLNKEESEQNEATNDGSVISSGKPHNQNIKIETIFRNEHIFIINKPYGISVHGDNSLVHLMKTDFLLHSGKSLSFTPGPLHRLDRQTTGLLAFSLSLKGARYFSEKIQTHEIKKIYLGIIQGILKAPETWHDKITQAGRDGTMPCGTTIGPDSEKRPDSTIVPDSPVGPDCNIWHGGFYTMKAAADGKECITTATPLSYGEASGQSLTLTRFEIETGRKHQIRLQSSIHGHPLFGDTAYGGAVSKCKELSKPKILLHARKMIFPADNPIGLPSSIEAPLPPDFENFIKDFKSKNF